MSAEALIRVAIFVLGAVAAMAISAFSDASDARKAFIESLRGPTERQKLETLCIEGNENACRVYEVRFGQRCIL